MTVILIRHGETVTSGATYAGRSDVALTPYGEDQACKIAEALAKEPLTHIFASPLSRSVRTAEPLARHHGIVPQVLPALSEIDFGALEGLAKGALGPSLRKDHAYRPIPGGESLADVWLRAGQVVDRLFQTEGNLCAVVGHFWINRLIWGRLHGLTFEAATATRAYRPETGSWVRIHPAPNVDCGRTYGAR